MSRTGLPAGASLAFFMASSNFLARMSSLLVSWNQESANLSSRWRCCSCRMLEACVRSTSGPFFGGASCERTAPKTGSTTSLAWQQGQVTFRLSAPRLLMAALYDWAGWEESASERLRSEKECPTPFCRQGLIRNLTSTHGKQRTYRRHLRRYRESGTSAAHGERPASCSGAQC